jgi:hypothetical protein
MKKYTLKEAAQTLNLTKAGVKSRIDKMSFSSEDKWQDKNGTIYISDKALEQIKNIGTKKTEPQKNTSDSDITVLLKMIDTLNGQLESKDEQIANLLTALNAAQTLHATDKALLLEAKQVENQSEKKSFWNKILRK